MCTSCVYIYIYMHNCVCRSVIQGPRVVDCITTAERLGRPLAPPLAPTPTPPPAAPYLRAAHFLGPKISRRISATPASNTPHPRLNSGLAWGSVKRSGLRELSPQLAKSQKVAGLLATFCWLRGGAADSCRGLYIYIYVITKAGPCIHSPPHRKKQHPESG